MFPTRTAKASDHQAIIELYLAAFPESEAAIVAQLASDLLQAEASPHGLNLIAESAAGLLGHIGFSPVTLAQDATWQAAILAPLAVHPDHQKQGIGSTLIREGMSQLAHIGIDTLFVYGDPNYYGRFGFSAEDALPYTPPHPLQYPHGWLAISHGDTPTDAHASKLHCVPALDKPDLW